MNNEKRFINSSTNLQTSKLKMMYSGYGSGEIWQITNLP